MNSQSLCSPGINIEGIFNDNISSYILLPPPVTLPAPFIDNIPLSFTFSNGVILLMESPIAYVIANRLISAMLTCSLRVSLKFTLLFDTSSRLSLK